MLSQQDEGHSKQSKLKSRGKLTYDRSLVREERIYMLHPVLTVLNVSPELDHSWPIFEERSPQPKGNLELV